MAYWRDDLSIVLGSRMVLTLGMTLSAIGSIILAWFGPSVSYWLAVSGFIVFGSGTGLAAPAMTASVLSAAPNINASRASGALNAARQVGGVVGIALLGSIVAANQNQLPVALGIVAVIFAIAAIVTYRWAV